MSKFNAVVAGTKHKVKVELDGQTLNVRPLTAVQAASALTYARDYAKKRGVDDPRDGNPLYDLSYMAAVVYEASEDLDGGKFFEGCEQILQYLDSDRIAYLHEYSELARDEASVQQMLLTPERMAADLQAMGVTGDVLPFFLGYRPLARIKFFAFLVDQYLNSQKTS